MKTKPTGIPLVGPPRGTEQAGVDVGRKQEPPTGSLVSAAALSLVVSAWQLQQQWYSYLILFL